LRSALHYVCGVGSEDCVRLLLDNGADVSAGVRAFISQHSATQL
jgi:ankyrin repeat protein